MQLAFLGGGNMGRALIGGLLRQGTRPEQISVGESVEAARTSLARDLGITATADNVAAVESAELIVLAVKPQDAASVLASLQAQLTRNRPVVLSVAAGIRASTLESWCGPGIPVVRAMPNRPALVGAGVTGLYAPAHVSATHRAAAERVMRAGGDGTVGKWPRLLLPARRAHGASGLGSRPRNAGRTPPGYCNAPRSRTARKLERRRPRALESGSDLQRRNDRSRLTYNGCRRPPRNHFTRTRRGNPPQSGARRAIRVITSAALRPKSLVTG
jgi:hypothetical protein